MRTKPTFKQKQFAKVYVATKGNGVKSALQTYNPKNYTTANAISTENLQKPLVQEEIRKVLEEKGLTIDHITTIHKRNLDQSKQLSVSQSAVETGYKLHGLLRDKEDKGNTNIAIVIER